MSDIVERLRAQGADAFTRKYSLGMWMLCDEAADRVEALESILREILTEDVLHVMDEWPDTKTVIGHINLPPLRKARAAVGGPVT
jgi:hypothetical protein